MIMKATKKPVTIEAIQFVETSRTKRKFGYSVETNDQDVARFIGKPTIPVQVSKEGKIFALIKTLEGLMTASIGDYIIKGVNGEFYPCKPDIFEQTYTIEE